MPAPVQRKPAWLTKPLPDPHALAHMRQLLNGLHLHTICQSANCPNLGECWAKATATFLILGGVCTRHCGFCNVEAGCPLPPDPEEPKHVAEAVHTLGLAHVVITSVTRDDLSDGGSTHFAATIEQIRLQCPNTTVEVLTPDFGGDTDHIATVLQAGPTVFAHNIETVEQLHRKIRPRFRYERSLQVLADAKKLGFDVYTKSSIMVGLGESTEDVAKALYDLRQANCDFVTIGQYLRPSAKHVPVVEYVHPETFELYRTVALEYGFVFVASGPFVRSSYDAANALKAVTHDATGA